MRRKFTRITEEQFRPYKRKFFSRVRKMKYGCWNWKFAESDEYGNFGMLDANPEIERVLTLVGRTVRF